MPKHQFPNRTGQAPGARVEKSEAHFKDAQLPRLLLLTPFADYDFFAPMRQGAADAARLLQVDVTFTGTSGGDVSTLAAQADAALRAGYAGIGINMTDALAFNEVAREALRKDIPLISFNVDSRPPNARLATVGQNMRSAGRRLGDAMACVIPVGARVLLTMHDAGVTALEERAAGIKEALQSHELDWRLVITGTDVGAAIAAVKAQLDNDQALCTILGTGEADTQAAGLTVERYFSDRGLVVAGFDTGGEILRLVQSGILHLTIDQQPYAQGFFAVANLTLAVREGLIPADVDTGARIVCR